MRPKFSVIIPTYSRPHELRGCLEAISQLIYPPEKFEVIVVDDGSPEPVTNIVESIRTRSNLNVKLIAQANAGPARARNRGAQEAGGEILAFTDDDCRPASSWLTAMEQYIAADTAIGGRTINALTNDPYAAASQMLVDYLYETYERKFRRNQSTAGAFFTSNNVAFPREMFLAIGGFSDRFRHAAGEDREICDRWVANGGKLKFAPEATVLHYHAMGLSKFIKQHFTYGRGAYHYHRLKSRGTGSPLDDTSLEFYTGILSYPFANAKETSANPILSTALLLVSQVANVSGFFFEISKNGRSANANIASPANFAPPAYAPRKPGAGQALGTSATNPEPACDFETVSKT